MNYFGGKLLAAVAMFVLAVGAFGQGNDNKRPPKNPPQVVEKPKGERPSRPPSNNNQGKGGDKRGKP